MVNFLFIADEHLAIDALSKEEAEATTMWHPNKDPRKNTQETINFDDHRMSATPLPLRKYHINCTWPIEY